MNEDKYLSLLRGLMGEIDAHDWSEVDADEVERLALLWRARYVDSYPDTQNAKDAAKWREAGIYCNNEGVLELKQRVDALWSAAQRFKTVINSPDFTWNGRRWPLCDHGKLIAAIDAVRQQEKRHDTA